MTTDGHLDAAVLAEYDEGLLTPTQASELEEHLAGCASCAAVLGQLDQVRARLADLPAEVTMPTSVAARIDDALADERTLLDREATPARVATVHPFRRRLPQLLAAAATVAAVAFAGYVVSTSEGGADSAENVTGADADADSDGGGAGGGGQDEAAREGAGADSLLPAPAERTTLTGQIEAIASSDDATGGDNALAQRLSDDCGVRLARELDTELIGVAKTDIAQPGAVLVVVTAEQPGMAQGFVVPACDASVSEALRELTVPIE